jgi:hypothetical protein
MGPEPNPEVSAPRRTESLQELITAWKSGMDSVIVLPYEGYFARRISRRHLVISTAVRNDPENYRGH